MGDALTKKSSLWEAYHQDMIKQKTRSRKNRTPRWIARLRGFKLGGAPKNVEKRHTTTGFILKRDSDTESDDAVDGNVESVEFPLTVKRLENELAIKRDEMASLKLEHGKEVISLKKQLRAAHHGKLQAEQSAKEAKQLLEKLLRQVKELESDNKRLGGNIPNFDIEKEIDDAAAQDQLLLESKVDKKSERTTSTIGTNLGRKNPAPKQRNIMNSRSKKSKPSARGTIIRSDVIEKVPNRADIEVMSCAATEIQKITRGWNVRKKPLLEWGDVSSESASVEYHGTSSIAEVKARLLPVGNMSNESIPVEQSSGPTNTISATKAKMLPSD